MIASESDPSEWSEEEIAGRALFELLKARPAFSYHIGILDIADARTGHEIVLQTYDEETARLFSANTTLNRDLSRLIEKPVTVQLVK